MRHLITALALLACGATAQAQYTEQAKITLPETIKPDRNILNHLDLSVTAGTTGIGFDLAMPVGEYVQLRTGATFMPHFHYSTDFGVETEKGTKKDLNRIANRLSGYFGLDVRNDVTMTATPSFNNFKFLVDVFPFKNKHWHFTAGFFLGGSTLGTACNATEDASTLLGVQVFNSLYDRIEAAYESGSNIEGLGFNLPEELQNKILSYGRMSIPEGKYAHDVYAEEDILYDHDVIDNDMESETWGEVIHAKGDVKIAKGSIIHKKGDPYRMSPDENGMVKATAKINRFKPYLGFGYGGPISKDKKTCISFDAGVMFWGGTPSFTTHDGTDLINDVEDIPGKVGSYIKLVKAFKVFPVVSLRITQRLF